MVERWVLVDLGQIGDYAARRNECLVVSTKGNHIRLSRGIEVIFIVTRQLSQRWPQPAETWPIPLCWLSPWAMLATCREPARQEKTVRIWERVRLCISWPSEVKAGCSHQKQGSRNTCVFSRISPSSPRKSCFHHPVPHQVPPAPGLKANCVVLWQQVFKRKIKKRQAATRYH